MVAGGVIPACELFVGEAGAQTTGTGSPPFPCVGQAVEVPLWLTAALGFGRPPLPPGFGDEPLVTGLPCSEPELPAELSDGPPLAAASCELG
jgi:hypothetical protein